VSSNVGSRVTGPAAAAKSKSVRCLASFVAASAGNDPV
jgi:hypothetical protein